MTDVKKVVLAYSGGLDTSVILKWLQDTYNCEVVTFTADLGQGEEVEPARAKAQAMGVKEIGFAPLTLTQEGEASPLVALGGSSVSSVRKRWRLGLVAAMRESCWMSSARTAKSSYRRGICASYQRQASSKSTGHWQAAGSTPRPSPTA